MTKSLLNIVNTLYTLPLSSKISSKFCDARTVIHYSVIQLPFGGTWTGSEDIEEYYRRWQTTLEIQHQEFDIENYDEALGTFTIQTKIQGYWKRTQQEISFSERHFGELRNGKLRRLSAISLNIDDMLTGYFTRAERLCNILIQHLLQYGVEAPTLELIADDFRYFRPTTRDHPAVNDIIHAQTRQGKQGFAQFFADLFGAVDLQFGNHTFLSGNDQEVTVWLPFTRFRLRSTEVDVTGNDVACYDRFIFNESGKLSAWFPHLSRTFSHAEFYGSHSTAPKAFKVSS